LKENGTMGIISLEEVRRQIDEKRKALLRHYEKLRTKRLLRSSIHIAQQYHDCVHCVMPIFPGDEYKRDCFLNGYRFWMEKSHYPCCYAPSDDEIDEVERELRREDSQDRKSSKKAA